MNLSDFNYELPKELIAQTPLSDRAASRLMVVDRAAGGFRHSVFRELPEILRPGDCLVLNDTKVLPARLYGVKGDSSPGAGARFEILLLHRVQDREHVWEALARPGKKLRPGDTLIFSEELSAKILETTPSGEKILEFAYAGIFEEILDRLGEMPLPPYITEKLSDQRRYQTIYAKYEGSAAAPTAGLHFTDEILQKLRQNGVQLAYLTLHVGLGTFRPVKVSVVEQHKMHSEYYSVDEVTCETINRARANGGRIIAVGTTSCRTLETITGGDGLVRPGSGDTDIFIYPGYSFKIMDGLLTNFHLPESTLIMLVSAFASRELILRAYEEAVRERYRFFSFGDAMLIL